MNEAEFLAKWQSEEPIYRAWGRFVQEEIERTLQNTSPSVDLQSFLKIPPQPRLKAVDSLIGKAFHRGKPYQDPYADIEDKVGLRFVVLLTADILKLKDVIEASDRWSWSLDKDFEADRDSRPMEFAYQSKHYVLKAATDTKTAGLVIPKGTPCEIQLRTLLQHAHSELTHDNIYKRDPGTEITKKIERTVAKSMALIEAVDDFFAQVLDELEKSSEAERNALTDLSQLYAQHVGRTAHVDKSNAIVLHAFRDQLGNTFRPRLEALLAGKPFIGERIRDRFESQYTFRQAWILLAYLVVSEIPNVTAERWPLTVQEIEPVFTDMGKTIT